MTAAVTDIRVGTPHGELPLDYYNRLPLADGSRRPFCHALGPGLRWVCTRPRDIPHGQHVASNGHVVLEVWDTAVDVLVDPFADIAVATSTRTLAGAHEADGVRWSDSTEWCRKSNPAYSGNAECTRRTGHPEHWACVSTRGSGEQEILWRAHRGVTPLDLPAEQSFPDIAEDGSPEDPLELVITERLVVGEMVRVRNRANILYVLKRRSSGAYEVLDLTAHEARVITANWLVPTEYVPTVEDFKTIGEWFAEDRTKARDIAIREYLADRWCMSGLNDQLRTMGLAEYEPLLRGEIQIVVPFTHTSSSFGKSNIEKLFKDVGLKRITEAIVRAALKDDDIEVDPAGVRLQAADLGRR